MILLKVYPNSPAKETRFSYKSYFVYKNISTQQSKGSTKTASKVHLERQFTTRGLLLIITVDAKRQNTSKGTKVKITYLPCVTVLKSEIFSSLKLSNFAVWKNILKSIWCRYNSIPLRSTPSLILGVQGLLVTFC